MKKASAGFFSAAVTAAAVLVSVTVLAFLCIGAIKMENRAKSLTEAVTFASSASEAFYSAESAEELAALLSGKAENGGVSAEKDGLLLFAGISESGESRLAEISVTKDGEPLYSLTCRKALVTEGE